nr:EAL domain-containing protein [Aliikangiella sp. G2MR2-5]
MDSFRKAEKDTIRLGLMPPLSGLVSLYGKEIMWAGQIACDEVNEAGGVLGQKLELIIRDDGSMPETAVPAAKALIERDKCVAIIGNLLSNSRISVAYQVANVYKVPYLNFSFYEGSIYSDYFFHFAALPNQQIDKMIPYVVENFGPKIYFAGSNYEWPRGSIDAAKRVLRKHNGTVVGERYIPMGELRRHVDGLLSELSCSGANVFVPYFAGADQQALLNEFSARGLKDRFTVVMGHYDEAMAATLLPEVREGFYSSNTYFMSLDTPENKNYLERLTKVRDVTSLAPSGNGILTNFGEGTYICVKAFAQALNEAGSTNADKLIEKLENICLVGPQGSITMDSRTHHATVNSYISKCNRDGVFEIVESFGALKPEIPEIYKPKFALESDRTPHRRALSSSGSGIIDFLSSEVTKKARQFSTAICILDLNDNILQVNVTFEKIWGDKERLSSCKGQDLWLDKKLYQNIILHLDEYGEWIGSIDANGMAGFIPDVQTSFEALHDNSGRRVGYKFTCLIPDELQQNSDKDSSTAKQIFSIADVAIIATDKEGNIVQLNRRACETFGYKESELLGESIHMLLPPRYRVTHKEYFEGFISGSESEVTMGKRGEISGYKKDGSIFPAEASISKFCYGEERYGVITLRDITRRKQEKERLVWKATHDPLTKLPNRALISERINQALSRAELSEGVVAILFIDIDEFKLINDSHGHDIGDQLLKVIGERILNCVGQGDVVARFGGDEFVILCESVADPEKVSYLAENLSKKISIPVVVDELELIVSSSIGIAYSDNNKHTQNDLLRMADAAMYVAKGEGRGKYKIFDESIHDNAKLNLQISSGLHSAIARKEFELRYQPIVNASTQCIIGAEALLRWYPAGCEISPAIFIPIAEITGTIKPIGHWVFQKACEDLVELEKQVSLHDDFYCSINLSAKQLNEPDIAQQFNQVARLHHLSPHNLLLEITETSLMSDVESNVRVLQQLNELGFGMAVDDFGTGYSSLAQLLRMPVSKLKVDRVFVNGMENSKELRTIVSAVINMAHTLGYETVAEGVENEAQVQILKELNCEYIQGFYYYKPLTLKEFQLALKQQEKANIGVDGRLQKKRPLEVK